MNISKEAAVKIPRAVGLFLIIHFGLAALAGNTNSGASAVPYEPVERLPFPAMPITN